MLLKNVAHIPRVPALNIYDFSLNLKLWLQVAFPVSN